VLLHGTGRRKGGASTTPFQKARFALQNTPQNSNKKEMEKSGTKFPKKSLPSAPPSLSDLVTIQI